LLKISVENRQSFEKALDEILKMNYNIIKKNFL